MRAVIGLGNRHRGDDAVGLRVVDLVADQPDLRRVEVGDDLLRLLEAWEGCQEAVLVDAVHSRDPAGTIRVWDLPAPLPALPSVSSHGMGLAEVLSLAQVLGKLPAHVRLYGVVGADFSPGAPLTPAVEEAAQKVSRRI